MTISNNGFISIVRGESFTVPLFINNGTVFHPVRYYIANDPEAAVYLGVMELNQPFERAVIRKKYTSQSPVNERGDLLIDFSSNDTKCLFVGKYYYMIKIKRGDGSIDTIVPETEFFIFDNAAGVANGKSKFNRKQGNVIK